MFSKLFPVQEQPKQSEMSHKLKKKEKLLGKFCLEFKKVDGCQAAY